MNPRPASHTQASIDHRQEVAQIVSGNVRVPLLVCDIELILAALLTHHGHFARVLSTHERESLSRLRQDLSVFIPRV